jgi:hypothetical protein
MLGMSKVDPRGPSTTGACNVAGGSGWRRGRAAPDRCTSRVIAHHPTDRAAKVIAQIDFDAEFVRPLLNRLYQLFIRHVLEFRLMAVLLDDGFGPGAFLLLPCTTAQVGKSKRAAGRGSPSGSSHVSVGLTGMLNPT